MPVRERPALSVVIPAYNEEVRLPATLKAAVAWAARRFGDAWEIVVVDDGSLDGTRAAFAAARRAAGRHAPRLRLSRHPENRGKGHAVRTGMLAARGDLVLMMDADLATPLAGYARLAKAVKAGADVAVGSRGLHVPGVRKEDSFLRSLMGRVFNLAVRALAVRGIRDTQCGFKLFTRAAARAVFSRTRLDGFAFDVEALALARRLHLAVAEVAVDWHAVAGSKVRVVRDSLRMFTSLFLINWYRLTGGWDDGSGSLRDLLSLKGMKRFVKFGVVGAIGFFVDTAVLQAQIMLVHAELYLRTVGPFVSFEVAVMSNYAFYHHWVWRERRKESVREYWVGAFHYNVAAGFGFLIKLGIMNLLIELVPFFSADKQHYVLANAGGVAVAAVFNFVIVERLVFRKKAHHPD